MPAMMRRCLPSSRRAHRVLPRPATSALPAPVLASFVLAALVLAPLVPGLAPLAAQDGLEVMDASALGQDPSELSQVELVSERRTIVPGDRFQIGLSIEVPEGWYTYWRNPGDAGAQTTVYWETDAGEAGADQASSNQAAPGQANADRAAAGAGVSVSGLAVSEIRWPRPSRWETPPFISYGYGDRVLLPMDVEAPESLEPGTTVRLAGTAEWLFCDEVCLFTDAPVALELEVVAGDPEPDPDWTGRFDEVRALLPVEPAGWTITARHGDDRYLIEAMPPESWSAPLDDLYFYPNEVDVLEHAAPQPVGVAEDGSVRIGLTPSEWATGVPERLEGIIAPPPGRWDSVPALEVSIPVEAAEPGVVAQLMPEAPAEPFGTGPVPASGETTLLIALALAFVGGLLLNLMPCVFPVISLKVMGFVSQAGERPGRVRLHGVAFAAGVVLSFLLLAGILIAVRAGGADVGWGFQLQDPRIVAALAAILVLIGLNFLGVFEVGVGFTRLGAAGGTGLRGSFLTGVLATIVASPCTAPFMGAAIGATLVMDPMASLAVFGGMGIGMASPYLALSMRPSLLRFLPRPGRWMETMKQLLAFPMFAVAIWLVWVFGLQTGVDGLAGLLVALLLLGLGAWVLGRWPIQSGSGRPGWVRPVAGGLVIAALAAGALASRGAPTSAVSSSGDVTWEDYSSDAVAAHQAAGRAVFVDFTAAWCLTCQVNKRTVLTAGSVEEAFATHDVALLRADWTRRDDRIASALAELGRNGVPVYALYPPVPGGEPELLPEILSSGIVRDALERIAPTSRLSEASRP